MKESLAQGLEMEQAPIALGTVCIGHGFEKTAGLRGIACIAFVIIRNHINLISEDVQLKEAINFAYDNNLSIATGS